MPPRKKKRTTKRKTARTAKRKTTTRKVKKKTAGKKKAFGGYTINFKGCEESLSKVFGNKPLAPSAMTKKIWAYVKKKKLNNN
tara:strand:+ start:422 stop:670 length:249 start_codon:yes stop_codon:yes gene_type:complete